jgi:hypothetical protein
MLVKETVDIFQFFSGLSHMSLLGAGHLHQRARSNVPPVHLGIDRLVECVYELRAAVCNHRESVDLLLVQQGRASSNEALVSNRHAFSKSPDVESAHFDSDDFLSRKQIGGVRVRFVDF